MTGSGGVKDPLGFWLKLFDNYRIETFPQDEVVTGILHAEIDAKDPALLEALDSWEGTSHCGKRRDGRMEVALVRPLIEGSGDRLWVHLVLFILTLFTTLTAGSLLQGVDPLSTRVVSFGSLALRWPTTVDFAALVRGIPFSLTLLGILGAHEMGHYVVARRHGVRASLPYFIPFPAYLSVVGTFGAFIRIKSPAVRRSILFDIGIAGPLASFILSAAALGIGLSWSTPSGYQGATLSPFFVQFADHPLGLGSSLFSHALAYSRFPMLIGAESIKLHPVAFAGWVGLLLTSLNLLPLGQLDGGHVLYGLLEKRQKLAAWVFILLLIPLGMLWWGWWLWGGIAVLLSRGRLQHPAVIQPDHGPDRIRMLLGVIVGIVFLITFIPLPIRFFG
jgi:membrane-associated protease RseP (regulator of RpoE activity)